MIENKDVENFYKYIMMIKKFNLIIVFDIISAKNIHNISSIKLTIGQILTI